MRLDIALHRLLVSAATLLGLLTPAAVLANNGYYYDSTYPSYYQQPTYTQPYYPQYQQYQQTYTQPYPAYSYPGYSANYYDNDYEYYDNYRCEDFYSTSTCLYRDFSAYDDYRRSNRYYQDAYYRSHNIVQPRVTDDEAALPSYYEDYLIPPTRSQTSRGRLSTPAPKYYPPGETIALYRSALHPANITVRIGTMVTWVNVDDGLYALEGENFDFDSVALGEGQEVSYSFDRVGTFHYHDRLHPSIKGMVRVTR